MALSDLIIDAKEIKEKALEEVVAPYFRYGPEGEVVITSGGFREFKGTEQILYFLAATFGRKFLGLKSKDTSSNNGQLVKSLNIKKNSVGPWLTKLRSRGLIVTNKGRHTLTTQGLYELSKIQAAKKGGGDNDK